MPLARSTIRKTFLFDVFVCALEGGIGYWGRASVYRWAKSGVDTRIASVEEAQDLDGFHAVVREDSEDEDLRIDIDVIATGVNAIIKGEHVRDDIKTYVKEGSRDNDAGMIDSDAADCIVQLGLFGKVVYG